MKFPFAEWFKVFKKTASTPAPEKQVRQLLLPQSLDEALDRLVMQLPPSTIAHIRFKDAEDMHFGLGRNLRNEWGLWDPESPLHKWFKSKGIGHADNMSGIILTSLDRRLKGRDIKLEEQIQYYRDYWLEKGIDPVTQERCTPVCRK